MEIIRCLKRKKGISVGECRSVNGEAAVVLYDVIREVAAYHLMCALYGGSNTLLFAKKTRIII